MHRLLCGLLIIGFLSACTVSQSEPASTSMPQANTGALPTPTLVEEPILFGEVTFDGIECTVDGPEEVTRGVYYFILKDESDKRLQLWVNQILEDKTFNDLLDWQDEPGVYRSPPDWIAHPRSTFSYEAEKTVHYLDQIGNYATLVGGFNPSSLWFCEPFRVVEAGNE